MARTIRDSKLESRAARNRLAPGEKPHWKTLIPGKLHLGYRRKRSDEPGQWLARHYMGAERYRIAPLGFADDFQDAGATADVLSFADAQRAAYAHTPPVLGRPGMPTVATAMADYIAWLRTERPAAATHVQGIAARAIVPVLGAKRLDALTSDAIITWRNHLAEQPPYGRGHLSPSTENQKRARRASANRYFGILRAALNHAFRAKKIDTDAAWRTVLPFRKTDAARPGFLSHEQVRRLVNAADAASGFRNLIIAAAHTGCRYSELAALLVGDFEHGKLHIRTSKSGRARYVTLTDEAVEFFRSITVGRAATERILPRHGDGIWNKSNQARYMRSACQHARISPPINFHAIRHTYASLSVMAGMPLLVLARNLGHADTVMIERFYGHLRADYIDEEIRRAAPRYGIAPEPSNVATIRGSAS
jgi:integrase